MNILITYHKVGSSSTSRLEAHAGFFWLLMKGIFYPSAQKVDFLISTYLYRGGLWNSRILRLYVKIQDHRKQSDDKSKKDNYLIFYVSVPPKTAHIVCPCFKSQIKGDLKSIKRNNFSDFHATIPYRMSHRYWANFST